MQHCARRRRRAQVGALHRRPGRHGRDAPLELRGAAGFHLQWRGRLERPDGWRPVRRHHRPQLRPQRRLHECAAVRELRRCAGAGWPNFPRQDPARALQCGFLRRDNCAHGHHVRNRGRRRRGHGLEGDCRWTAELQPDHLLQPSRHRHYLLRGRRRGRNGRQRERRRGCPTDRQLLWSGAVQRLQGKPRAEGVLRPHRLRNCACELDAPKRFADPGECPFPLSRAHAKRPTYSTPRRSPLLDPILHRPRFNRASA